MCYLNAGCTRNYTATNRKQTLIFMHTHTHTRPTVRLSAKRMHGAKNSIDAGTTCVCWNSKLSLGFFILPFRMTWLCAMRFEVFSAIRSLWPDQERQSISTIQSLVAFFVRITCRHDCRYWPTPTSNILHWVSREKKWPLLFAVNANICGWFCFALHSSVQFNQLRNKNTCSSRHYKFQQFVSCVILKNLKF